MRDTPPGGKTERAAVRVPHMVLSYASFAGIIVKNRAGKDWKERAAGRKQTVRMEKTVSDVFTVF